MATEDLKSTFITNRDATPKVMNPPHQGAILRGAAGTVEMTTADAGSTYRMFQVPSNARMHDLKLYCDDVGAAGAVNIGLYRTTADGGAVVDADFFASAVDINTAALNGSDVLYEAATATAQIDDIDKMIWEQLGLSADPGILYDVVIVSSTAAGTGGTLSLKGTWAV